jgi:RNA polymerase sigma-70 factor (ECF subfamily)
VAFHTTRWSLITRASRADEGSTKALNELCQIYWPAVYAMYRVDGVDPDRASDLTQGLFADLLEREDIAKADPDRGRFRTFLRTCARNWLHNERDRERAKKRGGATQTFSLDASEEEQRLQHEPKLDQDAGAIFERRWAQAVIEQALHTLSVEEYQAGRGNAFEVLRPSLEGDSLSRSWAEVAADLGTTEGALRVAVHRLRQRFRARLEAEVRDTLAEHDTDGRELAELLSALQS